VSANSGFVDANEWQGASEKYDVCVIGSGAGGAVTAALLQGAGFRVVVLEEGGHHTKAEFKMREDLAFPMLYQEAGTRATKDLGVAILQGRAVGGTTVVNWTTSFRTPEPVLEHWKKVHGVAGFAKKDLDPHWDAIEERLNIKQISLEETNRNNRTLYDGCKALGMQVDTTFRNTRNCFKSGYCGMGCPVDAKQSMLVTYLPDAVAKGATVVSRCRVDKLSVEAGKVVAAECTTIGDDGYHSNGRAFRVMADRFVVSAGAINTPAILMRSGLGGGLVGKRTFLHPVVGTAGHWKDPIEPFYGAPQSVASHALAHRGDDVGVFMEAAPLHPMMAALATGGFGPTHRASMTLLPQLSAHIALAIDGFHPSETGGTVELRKSGAPVLDYTLPPRVWSALREGLRALVKIDLAAGALEVLSGHDPALSFKSEADLKKLDDAPFDTNRIAVFSAHVMGGSAMGDDPASSVVRSADLRHHTLANLHIVDGSVFPTSLGVNPQESIYGLAHLMATRFIGEWKHG
jgi:choline dehydrogenase-like flavoprotein